MLSRNFVLALAPFALVALSACGSGTTVREGVAGDAPATGADDPYDAERQYCVDAINGYRAKVGAPALKATAKLEGFAATAAQYDADNNAAHKYFGETSGGHGIAFAENAIPGWPLRDFGSIEKIIDRGLAAMWAEGPGGGHYENMVSTKYTDVGCGFALKDGAVWALQDFR